MSAEPVLDYDALAPGLECPPAPCPLTHAFVDAYLAATGEEHPLFAAEPRGQGYAPPFCTCLVGFVKASLGGRWPDGTVHVRQEMRALRALRRGEPLALDVRVGNKDQRDGRRLIDLVGTTRDAAQRPVVVSTMTLLWAGAEQPARSGGAAGSGVAPAGPPEGPPLEPVSAELSRERLEAYGHLARAQDPIHLDPEYARRTRFGRNIAQGMLVATLLSRLMTRACGEPWLASGGLALRLVRPVFVGERITARGVALPGGSGAWAVWCEQTDGARAITGRATLGGG